MPDIIRIQKITAINLFDLSPNFFTLSHTHNTWELIYVDAGTLNLMTGHGPVTLKQGEILLHRPGAEHRTVCDGTHSASFCNIHFLCSSKTLNSLSQKVISASSSVLQLFQSVIYESQKTYAVSEYPLLVLPDAPKTGEQLVRNYLEIFLLKLLQCAKKSAVKKVKEKKPAIYEESFVDEIIKYLQSHVDKRVTLDALCNEFHYGKTFLCVSFKKKTGSSILNYHLDLKIKAAKKLLLETPYSIQEISSRLGFESSGYFSRCFTKKTGYSPSTFREMQITGIRVKKDGFQVT